MAARRIDTRRVSPDLAKHYWARAQNFFRLMRSAAAEENWDGAGLAGLRSVSKDHQDLSELVALHIRHAQTADQVGRLRRILAKKNLVEYMEITLRPKDALDLQTQVERYIGWARSLLGS